MCGIVGISAETNVAAEIYDALLMLQHRGQDAAGMVVCDENDKLNSRKSMGYVRDVFQQRHMDKLIGNIGIGHVRYPTAGGAGKEFAQPMYVNSPYGITLAHNGNLTNSKQLSNELFRAEMRHLNTDSDSEVLLNIFAHELAKQREIYPSAKHIFKAVTKTHIRCDGAYAVLALITGHGLLAFRDNNGIRPLSIGIRKGKTRDEYIIASEDSLFISTKRSRGKDQICLTSSKNTGKCTHKIGFFIGEGNPSNKLCRMFETDCSLKNNPLVLTETVERLYLKPSTLIR